MSTVEIYPGPDHERNSSWARTSHEMKYTANWSTQYDSLQQQEMTPWTWETMSMLPQNTGHLPGISESEGRPVFSCGAVVDHTIYGPDLSREDCMISGTSMNYGSPFFDSNWSDGGATWSSSPDLATEYVSQGNSQEDGCGIPVHVSTREFHTKCEPDRSLAACDHTDTETSAYGVERIYESSMTSSTDQESATTAAYGYRALTPVIRRRRTPGSKPTVKEKNKVTKRQANKETRPFACIFAPYGCSSTFSSKNEWKRHIQSQHLRLDFWRCDLCDSVKRAPNDFNRKDLFYQHVRRMHPIAKTGPDDESATKSKPASRTADTSGERTAQSIQEEAYLSNLAQRCHRMLRQPPQRCACLLCEHTFEGPRAWEDRLEHIGRHHEIDRKQGRAPLDPSCWREDVYTESWLSQEGLIERNRHGLWTLNLE